MPMDTISPGTLRNDAVSPLSVLVAVDHAEGVSGPHRNVVGTLNALAARRDVRVRLVTGRYDASESWYASGRVEVHEGFHPKKPWRLARNLALLLRHGRDVDVIYVPTNLSSLLLVQVLHTWLPVVAGPNVACFPHRKNDAPGWSELCILCDRWLEASDARLEHVKRQAHGVGRLERVHHAIDTAKFSPTHRRRAVWAEHGLDENRLKVLFVGRDNEALKGVEQLLRAFENLRKRRNNFDLVLVGRMRPETLEKVRVTPGVYALGFQRGHALSELYASSDIGVVPSSWENMPFVVLEAMASGLPVVASSVGGIPEQIQHERSGLLVELVSPAGGFRADAATLLEEPIQRLIDSSELRQNLGASARARIVAHFNEQRLAEELVQVLRATVQQKREGRLAMRRFPVWPSFERKRPSAGIHH